MVSFWENLGKAIIFTQRSSHQLWTLFKSRGAKVSASGACTSSVFLPPWIFNARFSWLMCSMYHFQGFSWGLLWIVFTVTFSAGLHRDCRRVLNTPSWVLVAQRRCFSVITAESHSEPSCCRNHIWRHRAIETCMTRFLGHRKAARQVPNK